MTSLSDMSNWVPECYICGTTEGTLMSVHAPGIYYICTGCIEAEEERTGKQGVFCYWKGLVFADDEEMERIEEESQAIKERNGLI